MVDPKGLVNVRCGEGVLLPTGDVSREGTVPLPRKKNFSLNRACFGAFRVVVFCQCPCQKNVEFSAWW